VARYCEFLAKFASERILKIGKHLAKIGYGRIEG